MVKPNGRAPNPTAKFGRVRTALDDADDDRKHAAFLEGLANVKRIREAKWDPRDVPAATMNLRRDKVVMPRGSGKRAAPKRHHVSGYMRPKKVVKRSKK